MAKNRNDKKPKSSKQDISVANDQLGENKGYEELNKLNNKSRK